MCTALTLESKNNIKFLARTMDFSFELKATPIYIPKKYSIKSEIFENDYETKYSFIGSGRNLGNFLFADGINEAGLCACALYFSDQAYYSDEIIKTKKNIAPHEFMTWILSTIGSISQLRKNINDINIVSKRNKLLNIVVPLHWIVCDRLGNSVIIEKTITGLHIYENEVNVMTNSPDYTWHLENLNHYSYLKNNSASITNFGIHPTNSQGAGTGAIGLPGDYTSQSRFIRSAFISQYIEKPNNEKEAIQSILRILGTVDIPKGIKKKSDGSYDYTQYKSIFDFTNNIYYIQDYSSLFIKKIELNKLISNTKPIIFDNLN